MFSLRKCEQNENHHLSSFIAFVVLFGGFPACCCCWCCCCKYSSIFVCVGKLIESEITAISCIDTRHKPESCRLNRWHRRPSTIFCHFCQYLHGKSIVICFRFTEYCSPPHSPRTPNDIHHAGAKDTTCARQFLFILLHPRLFRSFALSQYFIFIFRRSEENETKTGWFKRSTAKHK